MLFSFKTSQTVSNAFKSIWTNLKARMLFKVSRVFALPVLRLSKIVMLCFEVSKSCFATCEPIYPAPPVMSIFICPTLIIILYLRLLFYPIFS